LNEKGVPCVVDKDVATDEASCCPRVIGIGAGRMIGLTVE
jgi:hypothetical protein